MDRAFTTYLDVKNEDLEVKYTYWPEGDEVSIDQVLMGKHDVTAAFLDCYEDEISQAVWEDVRDGPTL